PVQTANHYPIKSNNRAASISLPDTLSILLSKNPPEQHRRPVKGLLRGLAPPVNATPKTRKTHGIQPQNTLNIHKPNQKNARK
ncbi:hypothetical protein, partial [Komagataeibacter sucrofermentans]|uniref:hypothetical protein n=1 Tax=Komagataeibacter sucrofermentans TaxID=1053551 RepID=UPI001ABEFC7F